MHPILLHLGSVPIHTYGAVCALAFLVMCAIALPLARRAGVSVDRVVDVIFWTSFAAVGGSRVLYVLTDPERMVTWRDWLDLRSGGLVFYGGLITGIPVAVLLMRRFGLPVARLLDVFGVALPFGHAVARLACVFAGCCYGRPTDLPWALTFTDPASPAPRGVPLHPTQLYEASALVLIGVATAILYRRPHREGAVILAYALLYAVARSIVEVFRGDVARGFVLEGWLGQTISTSQALSALVVAVALAAWVAWGRRAAR